MIASSGQEARYGGANAKTMPEQILWRNQPFAVYHMRGTAVESYQESGSSVRRNSLQVVLLDCVVSFVLFHLCCLIVLCG
jgi:hypothetical protein